MPEENARGDDVSGSGAPHVDGFVTRAVLGRGGFATVWEASRVEGGAPVAIKVGHGTSDDLVERFRREAAAMASVGPPFTPALYASGRMEDGRPYLVMERLFGETLDRFLSAEVRPPPTAVIERVGAGILAALDAAHAQGFVHRDLKPANVFLAGGTERVALLDFGLVKLSSPEHPSLTRSSVAVGTPEYMAPEQLHGERALDQRTDLYAFGVLAYYMLTLRLPFAGTPTSIEHGHLLLRPRPPSELAPMPKALEDLVLACLAKDPQRRPESAAALRDAFSAACRETETRARAAPAPPKLIAEGRTLVVVAVIECRGTTAPVAAVVTARGGFVPRQRGARYVAVFSGLDAHVPADAAIAAARELVQRHGARAALHLAEVTLRRRERGLPTVFGVAVDRPETWLPAEPWSGLWWTPDLARTQPEDALALDMSMAPRAALPSEPAPLDLYTRAPLLGRAEVTSAITASAGAVFGDGTPGLFTLLGDSGLGKTRLAEEAASLLRSAHPDAAVMNFRAPPFGAGESDGLYVRLLGALAGPAASMPEAHGHHAKVAALAEALQRRAREGAVAIIVDDAQWADAAVLDALELATLDGERCPAWVMVAAHPRLVEQRAAWGGRTRRAARVSLEPLAREACAELASRLLAPAEYPPAELLDRLAGWSGGNPASLTEIVQALKRAGMVRRRPGANAYQVAAAELDNLPPSPSWQWLAARRIAGLPPEIAACLRLCAVLGAAFARAELEGVLAALEARGGAGSPVDAGAGLGVLAGEGLLARSDGERYAFSNALFHDAVYESIDPEQRAEVHRAALAFWSAPARGEAEAEVLERLARHAGAAGEREQAAAAHLLLGDLAAAKHRHVEADQRYSAALASALDSDLRRRALALGRRGRSRVHLSRVTEAVDDIRAARALAAEIGDTALVAELLLEEATALDWVREIERSAARVEEARPLVDALGSPVLSARLLVGEGRTAWRQGRLAESIALLERGVAAATAAGDESSRVIGLICLAFQLPTAGRPDDAAARYEELIAFTSATGDLVHLCGAYVSRYQLWLARRDALRSIEDLRCGIALAREAGNPFQERLGCYNVAELLYYNGRTEDALDLAQRGWLLDERFLTRPEAWGALLLARIHLDRGDYEEARRLAGWMRETPLHDLLSESEVAPPRRAVLRLIEIVLASVDGHDVGDAWDRHLAEVRRVCVDVDEQLESLYWRARMALRRGARDEAAAAVEQAGGRLAGAPLWQPRFDALCATLASAATITPSPRGS